jgi:hypothetical protein
MSLTHLAFKKSTKGNYMNRTVFHFTIAIIFFAACSASAQGQAGTVGRGCGAEGADQTRNLRRSICADRHKQIHDRHVSAHYALISIPNLLPTYCK